MSIIQFEGRDLNRDHVGKVWQPGSALRCFCENKVLLMKQYEDPVKEIYLGWQGVCGGLVVPSVAAFVTPSEKKGQKWKTQVFLKCHTL
jgi:hypothetical protein